MRFLKACRRKKMTPERTRAEILALGAGSVEGDWARREAARQVPNFRDGLERQIDRAYLGEAEQVKSEKSYDAICAADVQMKPLQWLWENHLLRGALELTTGTKGMGKSQTQCSLAASTTNGCDWPDGTPGPEPMNVIMVTAEDSLQQVVKPRLIAAGANLRRVHFLRRIKSDGKDRWFLLGEDLDALEQMITDIGNVGLVTIDPITAYMGKIDSHNTTDVRGQLGPLADLAERMNVAFSAITHPPKGQGGKAIDQFIGSQAFIAAARIGHLCVPEMQLDASGQPTPTGRRLFAMVASNHRMASPIAYRIEEDVVGEPIPEGGGKADRIRNRATLTETVKVVWLGKVATNADAALQATRQTVKATASVDAISAGTSAGRSGRGQDGDRTRQRTRLQRGSAVQGAQTAQDLYPEGRFGRLGVADQDVTQTVSGSLCLSLMYVLQIF